MTKHFVALLLLVFCSAPARSADISNYNIDWDLRCDGNTHSLITPVGVLAISKSGWNANAIAADGSLVPAGYLDWLVVARRSDASYLSFTKANEWRMRDDYSAPYMNTTPNDAIEIAGSCHNADRFSIKVQLWYVE